MHKEVSLKLVRQHASSQNSPLRLKKSPKNQNQVFLSKQQRFPLIKMPKDQIPGPGSYIDPLARSRKLQKQKDSTIKNFSENHLDGFVSRQHQWIFGSSRLQFTNNRSSLGPGAYDISSKNMQKSMSPHSWGTSHRFNGSQWNCGQTSLGPGAYNVQKQKSQQKKEMGIFKSRSPKTFLQQLQKSIQKDMELQGQGSNQLETFNNQDLEQLQKIGNSADKQSKPKKMDPVFLSRSKRYELINPQNSQTGPGAYQLRSSEFIKEKIRKVKSISVSHNFIRKKQQLKSEESSPGPTSYEIQKFNMQKQLEKRISSLKGNMSLETRWKNNWKKTCETIPGPGAYNRQRYVFINEKQYEHKPLVNHHDKIDVPFLSSSSRIVEDKKPAEIPFGNYNVNQFDMSEKMRKKRYHLEKLKAMDISVPGFESSERRTTFNLGKLIKGLGKLEAAAAKSPRVQSQKKI